MEDIVKEKVLTQKLKYGTFTKNEYKGQVLGKYTKHFLYKRINNKMKVMRIVLLKRVPLSVIHFSKCMMEQDTGENSAKLFL